MEEELILLELNLFHANLQTTERHSNHLLGLLILCSLTVIALSVDIITISQEFILFGITIKLKSWLLPIVGAWLIGLLYTCFVSLQYRAHYLKNYINSLYGKSKYKSDGIKYEMYLRPSVIRMINDFLVSPIFRSFLLARILYIISMTTMVLVLILIPLVAEVLALIKVVSYFDITLVKLAVAISFAFLTFLIISYIILLSKLGNYRPTKNIKD